MFVGGYFVLVTRSIFVYLDIVYAYLYMGVYCEDGSGEKY